MFNLSKKKLHSCNGMTLIETLIATSIALIISLGIATIIFNLQKEQKKQSLLQNLMQIQSHFESLIKNEASWKFTVQDATNTSFECLRRRKKCDGTAAAGNLLGNFVNSAPVTTFVNLPGSQIVLHDGANNVVYDGRTSTNNKGFTEAGTECNGFSYNMDTGNDICSIGYIISWRAMSSEDTPQLLVTAKLIFNPSNSHPLKQFINATVSSTTYSKYDVKVVRTANSLAQGFLVTVPFTAYAGDCLTAGFGTCSTSVTFTNYTGYSEDNTDGGSDPFDLVDAISSSVIRIKSVGTYKCTISSSAFAVNTVRTELYRTTPSPAVLASQNSFASTNLLNYANISFTSLVEVSVPNTELIIRQRCQSLPSAGPPGMAPMSNMGLYDAEVVFPKTRPAFMISSAPVPASNIYR